MIVLLILKIWGWVILISLVLYIILSGGENNTSETQRTINSKRDEN